MDFLNILNSPEDGEDVSMSLEEAVEQALTLEVAILEDEQELFELDTQYAILEDREFALETYLSVIEKEGMSKSFAVLMDPKGEYATINAIPAMESLDDVATHGDGATAAEEGIKETLKKIWEKIKAFFIKIGQFIKKIFQKFLDLFKTNLAISVSLINKLKQVESIDTAKLKDVKVNVFSKPYTANEYETDSKDIASIFGIIENIQTKDMTDDEGKAEADKYGKEILTALKKAKVVSSASYKNGSFDVTFDTEFKKKEVSILSYMKDASEAIKKVESANKVFMAKSLSGLEKKAVSSINKAINNATNLAKGDEAKKGQIHVYKVLQAGVNASRKVGLKMTKVAAQCASADMAAARTLLSAAKLKK